MPQTNKYNKNIIIALDFTDKTDACDFTKKLDPSLCRVKVGKALFTTAGPDFVKYLQDLGFDVFLDLKFHDIPNTVETACIACANLGVWMLTVHTAGGLEMLMAARKGVGAGGQSAPLIMGVTVLTSIAEDMLPTIGINNKLNDQVLLLAGLAVDANLDGVVCSALEVSLIKKKYQDQLKLLTPGISLTENHLINYDQKRVMTPTEAMKAGSNYLVIGRAVTKAKYPQAVLESIILGINN